MSRTSLLLTAAALLLAALAALWFFTAFERVEQDVEVGYQGAARANPFLAAERLFTRLGAPARTLAAEPPGMPPADHALLLVSPARSLSSGQFAKIFDWVRRGGRLLVALDEAPSIDPILRHWSVEVSEPPEAGGPEVFEVTLREGTKATVEILQARRLKVTRKDTQVQMGSPAGLAFVRYAEGAGSVTFLADAGFLSNGHIGQHDHAALAWALVRAGGDAPAGVWLAVRDEVPTLAQLLAQNAWMALASGGLLIAAWLWSAGARFGPLVPDPPRGRRSLLEHVEASGDFLWRTGRGSELVQGARQALFDRIDVREPGWRSLPAADLVQRLAAGARLPAARIDRALYGAVTAPADLVQALQTLETVRRSL
ncbi:MAG TPA: DUF4350 domain-containing protein [Thermoanaerobaculia bacterium]|nr:DUF4350 domain-containing protein [Thermoanaerobaculia bacterium]